MEVNNELLVWWNAIKSHDVARKVLTKVAVFVALIAALTVLTYQTNPAIVFLIAPVCIAYAFWRFASFLVDNYRDL